jgi:hypothetical protein
MIVMLLEIVDHRSTLSNPEVFQMDIWLLRPVIWHVAWQPALAQMAYSYSSNKPYDVY